MKLFLISAVVLAVVSKAASDQSNLIQGSGMEGCSDEISEEQNMLIDECSAQVQSAIFAGFDKTMQHGLVPANAEGLRKKRQTEDFSPAIRRTAGCVLQCLFGKYEALGPDNIPTRQGLVSIASYGVNDRRFFMAAVHEVDRCFNHVRDFKHKIRTQAALPGEYCDLAFDIFNCVADGMDEFCEQQ